MSSSLIEAKYTLGPRKVYANGEVAIIALGKRFKPLLGRYVFVTVEVLKEEPDPPKPKLEHSPP